MASMKSIVQVIMVAILLIIGIPLILIAPSVDDPTKRDAIRWTGIGLTATPLLYHFIKYVYSKRL